MADFKKAWKIQSKIEGGFNMNLGDGAGMTYRGITEKWQGHWEGWSFIRNKLKQGKIKEETIFPELETLVENYYRREKWALIHGDLIESQEMANMLFSFVVMSGQARTQINKAINKYYQKLMVAETNQLSLSAVKLLNTHSVQIYPYIYDQRLNYLKSLTLWQKFQKSWLRAMSFFPKTLDIITTNANKITLIICSIFIIGGTMLITKKKSIEIKIFQKLPTIVKNNLNNIITYV